MNFSSIDQKIQKEFFDSKKLVGANFAIHIDGSESHFSKFGFQNREKEILMDRSTLFQIHSMTKPIVSFGFMILVDRGLISLEDKISEFIPKMANMNVLKEIIPGDLNTIPAINEITILDLLRHTSGFTYSFMEKNSIDQFYRDNTIGSFHKSLESLINILSETPLLFEPGTKWNYSVSTDVLGFIIQKITNKTLGEFLDEEIFQKLDMTDTSFHLDKSNYSRIASMYDFNAKGEPILDQKYNSDPLQLNPNFNSGGGGLISSVDDYLKFANMILYRGNYRNHHFISDNTFSLISQSHTSHLSKFKKTDMGSLGIINLTGYEFGLGFSILTDPEKSQNLGSKGELAWVGKGSTFFWVDPSKSMTVAFFTQLTPFTSYDLWHKLRNIVYSSFE